MGYETQYEKQAFTKAVCNLINLCKTIMVELPALKKEYANRAFQVGGENEIVDDDIASIGIKAEHLLQALNMGEQLRKFFENETVTSANWGAVVNRVARR